MLRVEQAWWPMRRDRIAAQAGLGTGHGIPAPLESGREGFGVAGMLDPACCLPGTLVRLECPAVVPSRRWIHQRYPQPGIETAQGDAIGGEVIVDRTPDHAQIVDLLVAAPSPGVHDPADGEQPKRQQGQADGEAAGASLITARLVGTAGRRRQCGRLELVSESDEPARV